MNAVRISVLSTSKVIEKLEMESPNARKQAEEAVLSMFMNKSVYNAWLAYEPSAFDGRDALHTSDYPGAPSGRFILSYIVENGEIIVARDMHEETLDDPEKSPWYTIARDEGRLYIDVDNAKTNLYRYREGDDPVYTMSIVAPVYRDGQVIGCVGADVLFDTMTFGINNTMNASVAVFYSDGRVFYADELRFAEESIDTLGFTETERIKQAFDNGKSLFLPNEYSAFADESAFTYFQPIRGEGMDGKPLYLYVALPRAETNKDLTKVLILAAAVGIAMLAVLLILLAYVVGRISKPINELSLSAEAISQGKLDTEIAYFPDAHGEIGRLSKALYLMVEQFRVYIIEQNRIQEETALGARLDGILERANHSPDEIHELSAMLAKHFGLYKAAVVSVEGGRASVISSFVASEERAVSAYFEDFQYHNQVAGLLANGEKLLFLNAYGIEAHKASFADKETVSLCVVPFSDGQDLLGYLIMENNNRMKTFRSNTESILVYIGEVLSRWLAGKKAALGETVSAHEQQILKQEAPAGQIGPEQGANTFITAARVIDGLYVNSALETMGGMEDIYEQSLRLFAKTAAKTVKKMDTFISGGDIGSFAIEIHGIKGALNNVGASELGAFASRIEKMAKVGELESSAEAYKEFRTAMVVFMEQLKALSNETGAKAKKPGDIEALRAALAKTSEAAGHYDSMEALETISEFSDFTYGTETDRLIIDLIRWLEAYDCERALDVIDNIGGILNDAGQE